jgi:hypothetical protein
MPDQLRPFLILTLFVSAFLFNVQVNFEHTANRAANPTFRFPSLPSPSKDDAATTAKLTLVDGTPDGGSAELSALTDGQVPTHADEPGANFYFNAGTMGGRIRMDFPALLDITRIISYSWHPGSRGPQLYKLYAADGSEANLNLAPRRGIDPATCGWRFIATVSTIPSEGEEGGQYAASVTDSSGSLGKIRYLLFDCFVTEWNDDYGNTFYSEIDVLGR